MKTIKELEEFYYGDLESTLDNFEKGRKKAIINMVKKLIVCILSFGLINYALIIINIGNLSTIIFLIAFLFHFFFAQSVYASAISDYNDKFKNSIIEPLIKSMNESFVYCKDKHISIETFMESNLFRRPDKLTGDDYVVGEIDGVEIEFSDVKAQTISSGTINTDRPVEYNTFFEGLFIKSNFNKHFEGKTFVYSSYYDENSENNSFVFSYSKSSSSSEYEQIKMDNAQFTKEFNVYSTDQIEARYILTPSMMERLLEFKRKSIYPLYISFVNDCIHIVICTNKNNFEANLFQSVTNHNAAFEYILHINLASTLVNNLKLNQKLWGKR